MKRKKKKNDFISREAAREKLCGMCRWEGTAMCSECEHPIDDIPAAEVKPTAYTEWIDKKFAPYRTTAYCRNCRAHVVWFTAEGELKYCPYCLAVVE